ncbi:hypothetical protein AtubIFM55763_010047 [Aspergillus tubingensis]|nr:hypothetical protein AtubIFM54640_003233 [Aspergillus tubingensis]GLA77856.1 hypothetical protein AtubIFM55763_010047 [Aspergillus tubingensis]GLB18187.1 hypothetical protein AtubIFM61612_008078 [Aspergillus tubingensis]
MKRPAAIITDHGGRTSHAAIVSYEIGVPVIVGTYNATYVLYSVGEVEEVLRVSADNGLQVHLKFETPSNVVLAEQFLTHFDAFSIGLKDFTQLTLEFIVTRMS